MNLTNVPVWNECSPTVNYSRSDLLASVVPVYQGLLQAPNFRILVYSGDVDGIVSTTGTRMWIREQLVTYDFITVSRSWAPWMVGINVGGYVTQYNGGQFTFATVRGAGHMVPGTQPERAYQMLTRWLAGSLQ